MYVSWLPPEMQMSSRSGHCLNRRLKMKHGQQKTKATSENTKSTLLEQAKVENHEIAQVTDRQTFPTTSAIVSYFPDVCQPSFRRGKCHLWVRFDQQKTLVRSDVVMESTVPVISDVCKKQWIPESSEHNYIFS
ncbi:hypothetical protein M514_05057 [Trichuris suis]|uniref:Uncharacterized protein n=1 Tax=Trichuris suis TaxID=68888 RepID=A0A085NCT6_9BILA|nr:hypothetical protein M514_05057 [Trichuris suis]